MTEQELKNEIRLAVVNDAAIKSITSDRFIFGIAKPSTPLPRITAFSVLGPDPILTHDDQITSDETKKPTLSEYILQLTISSKKLSQAVGIATLVSSKFNGYTSEGVKTCFVKGIREAYEEDGKLHSKILTLSIMFHDTSQSD